MKQYPCFLLLVWGKKKYDNSTLVRPNDIFRQWNRDNWHPCGSSLCILFLFYLKKDLKESFLNILCFENIFPWLFRIRLDLKNQNKNFGWSKVRLNSWLVYWTGWRLYWLKSRSIWIWPMDHPLLVFHWGENQNPHSFSIEQFLMPQCHTTSNKSKILWLSGNPKNCNFFKEIKKSLSR